MTSDPILAEVVRHGLQAVAEEMGAALVRTAHSVNIRDRRDFSCGVFTAQGELAAQAENIPVHLGLLAGVIGRIHDRFGHDISAGQMVVTNDPWISGSHLPDVVFAMPVDVDGTRLGYVANMAHQVDLGGLAPGSLSLGAKDVFQEGFRVSPLVIARDGEIDQRIVELFRINSRTPDMVVGDLLAQAAANFTGMKRYADLARRTGRERLEAASASLIEATARRLRDRLTTLDEASARFEDTLEWHDEGDPRDLKIAARISVSDGTLRVDLSDCDDQVAGPINATRPLTMSCVLYVVKAMLDPELASNAGLLAPIRLVTRPGSLVDATFPAAVALCTSITSQRICDALIGAFNQLLPERAIAASTGSMNALIIGGGDLVAGRGFSYVETYGGGQGVLTIMDGADGVHTHMTNTANSPIELIERSYPFTVQRYGLVPASGGAGRYRGGHGLTREIRLDEDAIVTVHRDRTRHRPWAIAGGEAGSFSRVVVREPDGERTLPGKCTVALKAGTVVRVETAGGGGAGPAGERTQELRERDRRDGLAPRTGDG